MCITISETAIADTYKIPSKMLAAEQNLKMQIYQNIGVEILVVVVYVLLYISIPLIHALYSS